LLLVKYLHHLIPAFAYPITCPVPFGIGPMGGEVNSHGINLLAEAGFDAVDLLVQTFPYALDLLIGCPDLIAEP